MNKMKQKQIFLNGIFSENPILVSMLGLCANLAITTKLENALGMGLAITFVLVLSNFFISLIRNIVPNEIRIPVFVVVIASFVTLIKMLMAAFLPGLNDALGIFIPLIVVNCIILGRAEAFASSNGPLSSIVDGLGVSIGYTLVMALISAIREILGTGIITVWGDLRLNINQIFNKESLEVFTDFFVNPAGAYIVLGVLFGTVAAIKARKKKVGESK